MAPVNTMRLSIVGHQFGGEQFDCSLWFMPEVIGTSVPTTNADAQTAIDAIAAVADFTAFLNAVAVNLLPATAGIDQLRLYCYPTGGSSAQAIASHNLAIVGSSTGTSWPLQSCLVASLRTGQSGRSYRGRIYLPCTAPKTQANFQVGVSTVGLVGNAMVTALGTLETTDVLPSSGILPVVASGVRNAATTIEQVIIDTKPDIQRRRANKLAPGTTSVFNIT